MVAVVRRNPTAVMLLLALAWPAVELVLPLRFHIAGSLRTVFIFAILALGLNVVSGFTGLLNLGIAAFMAIGAYAFGILTCDTYPFQIGFWPALLLTLIIGAMAGFLLGAPTIRLRGDYLAIVTLGFGEIVQDVLKNLQAITKGMQGINPLPSPTCCASGGGWTWRELQGGDHLSWYWLTLAILSVCVLAVRRLERSHIGRAWISVREDELASRAMGIRVDRVKLLAFATGASLAALSGALFASSLSSTGEPSNYDFQVSILALCIIIVGGIGSVAGVLIGSLVMIGFNSIVLVKVAEWMQEVGWSSTSNVLASPNNWKYLIFGVALVLMVRFRPQGLLPPTIEDDPAHDAPDEPGALR